MGSTSLVLLGRCAIYIQCFSCPLRKLPQSCFRVPYMHGCPIPGESVGQKLKHIFASKNETKQLTLVSPSAFNSGAVSLEGGLILKLQRHVVAPIVVAIMKTVKGRKKKRKRKKKKNKNKTDQDLLSSLNLLKISWVR
jgi:hypothetical protein